MVSSSIYYLNHESEEVFDASLIQSNLLVKALLSPNSTLNSFDISNDLQFKQFVNSNSYNFLGSKEEQEERVNKYENDLAIVVQDKENKLIFSTVQKLNALNISAEGFDHYTIGGQQWRALSQYDQQRKVWISSLHKREVRDELNLYMVYSIFPPIFFSTLLLLIAILYVVKNGLSPLKAISDDLMSRDSNNLTAMPEQTMSAELRQIVIALNTMFSKVDTTLSRERRFTDDAAHELRTPLTGMHLQLNLVENSEAKERLAMGVQRMERLVSQLLQLARVEPTQKDLFTAQDCDLESVLANTIADIYPIAIAKNVEISLVAEHIENVKADSTLIEVLLRNLLENALHYSMTSKIEVILKVQGTIQILVVDHGVGLSDADKSSVIGRFYRVDRNDGLGSGLGLSIVDNIAKLHRWQLTLQDTKNGGLTVQLILLKPVD
jgi:signal transduction histidine kinase